MVVEKGEEAVAVARWATRPSFVENITSNRYAIAGVLGNGGVGRVIGWLADSGVTMQALRLQIAGKLRYGLARSCFAEDALHKRSLLDFHMRNYKHAGSGAH